jgi:hypothetical protein
MSFPVHDWQFWVATAIAAAAAGWLIYTVAPFGKRRRRRKAGTRASLTIGGRPVGQPAPDRECH